MSNSRLLPFLGAFFFLQSITKSYHIDSQSLEIKQLFTVRGKRHNKRASVIQHKAECPLSTLPSFFEVVLIPFSVLPNASLFLTFTKLCPPFPHSLSSVNTCSPQLIIISYLSSLSQLVQYKALIPSCSERFHIFFRKDGNRKGKANDGHLASFMKLFRIGSSIFIAD